MSSNINALLATVNKLSGTDNYYDWAFQMQLILMRAGCWGVVNGSVARPDVTDVARHADWNTKSADGYTAIGLTLHPDQTIHIRDCGDAPEAWNALERMYSRNSSANRIMIKHRMQSTRLIPGDTISDYLNTITTCASQLRSMGIPVSEQDVTDILIANLPPSYDPVATALMTRHGRLTVSEASSALLEYELRTRENNLDLDRQINANVAKTGTHGKRGRAKNPTDSKPTDDIKKCYRCQQPGHYARDCMAPAPVRAEKATFAVADSRPFVLF